MKYLILMLSLCVGSVQAAMTTIPIQPYEITDSDCSALKDIARAVTMMRNEGVPVEMVKSRISTGDNVKRKEFIALLPRVMKIVDNVYDGQRVRTTPAAEAEDVYIRCMDHVYAGTDF